MSTYHSMLNARVGLPTVLVIIGVVGAGSFAAGQSISPAGSAPASLRVAAPSPQTAETAETDELTTEGVEPLPPGHPLTTGPGAIQAGDLPAGHPPVDSMGQTAEQAAGASPDPDPGLVWTAPPRWQAVPNTNAMRLATYRVPRAPGDSDDAELSVTQAGGSVEANATRWIGQFDAVGQKTATRAARSVGALDVVVVAVQGTYSGGMGMGDQPTARAGWALLGAIVSTGERPHFFKLTGPARTVAGARREFDAMIGSLATR